MLHDSANVLDGKLPRTSIVERVCFVGYEVKGNACRYFETTREGVDLVFHARVVVEGVVIKVAELKSVSFQGGAIE